MSDRRSFISKRDQANKQHYQHHNDDTAPFDVPAFLAILDGGGTEAAANHYAVDLDKHPAWRTSDHADPNEYDNVRTHFFGDDCPGGHHDDDPGTFPPYDYYEPDDNDDNPTDDPVPYYDGYGHNYDDCWECDRP